MNTLSLYIHFPFCVRKCQYCDFLSGPGTAEAMSSYINDLKNEIAFRGHFFQNQQVVSIFFGGGTPSLLSGMQINGLMTCIRNTFVLDEHAEITCECNPGTLSEDKLNGFLNAGINRLSIGLQSANDAELEMLGRIHRYAQFEHNYQLARQCGFKNINIDLMSALPGQSVASYEDTLDKVLSLEPEHISAYSLIIEEGTPFAYALPAPLPSEDDERLMYHLTKTKLAAHGYSRYEISNYAKKGYACRHNLVYWQGGDYLGLGLGSSSYMDGVRFHNTTDLNTYVNQCAYVEDREELSVQAKMEEFMFLGLRVMAGVSGTEFEKRFGKTMEDVYGDVLRKHEEEGLLRIERKEARKEDRKEAAAAEPAKGKTNIERVMLTTKGVDVSNYVFADFLL